jgi:2-amino-4-hydroxy-6-hydroxymethyldihydropteridine diphosphokinase
MHRVYFGLGSNMGNRAQLLEQAIQLIGERVGPVTRRSSLVETEPWGFESANRFLNGVVRCETERTPREVLLLTQQIERDLGKSKAHATRRTHRPTADSPQATYHDRPIDIDILLYDDLTVDEPDLKIPHPLMTQREFVMTPLREAMSEE